MHPLSMNMAGMLCAMQDKAGEDYTLWEVFPGAVGSMELLQSKVSLQPLLLAEDAGQYRFFQGGTVYWQCACIKHVRNGNFPSTKA